MATTQTPPNPRRSGPVPTPGRVRVTLYLDEALAEWGKQQDGGLSELVRNLLVAEKDHKIAEQIDYYPVELRANYQKLIRKKLDIGLTEKEENTLEDIRAQINAIDRTTPMQQHREKAMAVIEKEIADLRREIESFPLKKDIGQV
jgi:hypothetical protein